MSISHPAPIHSGANRIPQIGAMRKSIRSVLLPVDAKDVQAIGLTG